MLWKSKPTHGPLPKYATPISQPVWLGVGIEDPLRVAETQVHSWGTLGKISTYISPYKYMHVHTRPFLHIVCPILPAGGYIPRETHQEPE